MLGVEDTEGNMVLPAFGNYKHTTGIVCIGEQNLPSQNVSLWYEDYFRLGCFKETKGSGRAFISSALTA